MKKLLEKIKNKPLRILVIVLIVIFSISLIFSLSRYIRDVIKDYYLESKNFYFNSNRLKKEKALYQVNNWTGVGDFTIEIEVNSRKNNLLASNYDISYDINYTCPSSVTCTLVRGNDIIYTATHTDTFSLIITPNRAFNDGEAITVYVEATSTSPYVSTISADFQIVVGKKGVSYTIDDEANRQYLLVSITNAITSYTVKEAFGSYQVGDEIDISVYKNLSDVDKSKCVSITITLTFDPNIVVIDTTSSTLKDAIVTNQTINGVTYVNGITFTMDAMSSKEVRFYKIDHTKNYTYPFVNNTSIVNFSAH